MYEDEDNDCRFPDESPVEVRYPAASRQEEQSDREQWPWLPGTIVNSAARTNGMCASRSASWPSCATADGHRTARPAVISTTPIQWCRLGDEARGGREPGPGPSAVPGFLVPAGYGPSALFRVGRAVPTMMV